MQHLARQWRASSGLWSRDIENIVEFEGTNLMNIFKYIFIKHALSQNKT